MTSPDAVIKLGGSLLRDAAMGPILETLHRLAGAGKRLVIVPGGGRLADAVREACRLHRPGESAAHWMAVLAMDQHAHLIAGLLPGAVLATDPEHLAPAGSRLAVLAPYAWLRREDPLPHGWDVTSDSIAAWVAGRLGAPLLVLLKSVEGIRDEGGRVVLEMPVERLGAAAEVDRWFARALPASADYWIVSGWHPERLQELLLKGSTYGTRVGRAPAPPAAPGPAPR